MKQWKKKIALLIKIFLKKSEEFQIEAHIGS